MTLTLTIETSCDETAVSIINFKSEYKFEILSEMILSQIDIHKEYGGVFPAIAKREHLNNLFPIFIQSLEKANLLEKRKKEKKLPKKTENKIKKILDRDWENFKLLVDFYENYKMPKIKLTIATYGPGLEIALWTGFNFTKALAEIFSADFPKENREKKENYCHFIGSNHMEGHLLSSLIYQKVKNKNGKIEKIFSNFPEEKIIKNLKNLEEEKKTEKIIKDNIYFIEKISYPSLGLLISGGHTELVLIKDKLKYKIIGKTLDDAVGEAYDKSARLLGIDYPGGPEISKNAQKFEKENFDKIINKDKKSIIKLPRPMLQKANFDFSFSGLKTAVLYIVKKEEEKGKIKKDFTELLSAELEDSISEVLFKKTKKAIEKFGIKNLLVGGGVSANQRIRTELKKLENNNILENKIKVYFPDKKYTGDNATMIAIAGYSNWINKKTKKRYLKVNGNLELK